MTAKSVIKHAKLIFTSCCTMTVADNEPWCYYHKLKMVLWKTMLQLWGGGKKKKKVTLSPTR